MSDNDEPRNSANNSRGPRSLKQAQRAFEARVHKLIKEQANGTSDVCLPEYFNATRDREGNCRFAATPVHDGEWVHLYATPDDVDPPLYQQLLAIAPGETRTVRAVKYDGRYERVFVFAMNMLPAGTPRPQHTSVFILVATPEHAPDAATE